RLQGIRASRREPQVTAFLCEDFGNRRADTFRSARDQGALATKTEIHASSVNRLRIFLRRVDRARCRYRVAPGPASTGGFSAAADRQATSSWVAIRCRASRPPSGWESPSPDGGGGTRRRAGRPAG